MLPIAILHCRYGLCSRYKSCTLSPLQELDACPIPIWTPLWIISSSLLTLEPCFALNLLFWSGLPDDCPLPDLQTLSFAILPHAGPFRINHQLNIPPLTACPIPVPCAGCLWLDLLLVSPYLSWWVSSLVWTFPLCLHHPPPKKPKTKTPKDLDKSTLTKYNT